MLQLGDMARLRSNKPLQLTRSAVIKFACANLPPSARATERRRLGGVSCDIALWERHELRHI